MARMTRKMQRLALEYGRVDREKRNAARKVFRRAQKMSGMSRREFAGALRVQDEEAVGFMRAAASKNDKWMRHFTPAGEDRDWDSFFQSLMACLERFIPLILTFF